MSPGTMLYGLDWTFVGALFADPHAAIAFLGTALAQGFAAGAIAVALTVVYHHRRG